MLRRGEKHKIPLRVFRPLNKKNKNKKKQKQKTNHGTRPELARTWTYEKNSRENKTSIRAHRTHIHTRRTEREKKKSHYLLAGVIPVFTRIACRPHFCGGTRGAAREANARVSGSHSFGDSSLAMHCFSASLRVLVFLLRSSAHSESPGRS